MKIDYHCIECGKLFKISHYSKRTLCDECLSKHKKRYIKKNMGEAKCLYCGKLFLKRQKKHFYCSKKCNTLHYKQELRKTQRGYLKTCPICNDKFFTYNFSMKYCEKCRKTKTISRLTGVEWKNIQELIFERDGYKCSQCNLNNNIVVHHIVHKSDRGSDNEDNLITLCSKCHSKVHNEYINQHLIKKGVISNV